MPSLGENALDDDLLDDLLASAAPPQQRRPPGGLTAPAAPVNVTVAREPTAHVKHDRTAAVGSAADNAEAPLRLPADLDEKLFPHQREGIQWLHRKHCHARACLLADEQGLGKTIQVAAFLGQLYRQQAIRTTLVMAPATLVPMWESALLEWGRLPRNVVEVVHGDGKAKRAARWNTLRYGLPRVMVTTYGVLCQDAKPMSAVMVDYVVLDEAHTIKNADTNASKAAQQLSTRHKIALTGTPLMNNFRDLWSLFEFMDGDIIAMGRRRFGQVSRQLLSGNERDASAGVRRAAEEALVRLQAAIQPYMLRREKRDVDVVGSRKHDVVVWVTLSETQERLYRAILVSGTLDDGDGEGGDTVGDGSPNALRQVTVLSQVCNHPWLHLTERAFHEALERPVGAGAPCEEVGDIYSGAKLCAALTLLERCVGAGRKALVFSRSKMLLSIFSRLLSAKNVRHSRIDGDIANAAERMKAVEAFNTDPSVKACLLTTQVGGVGLTFQSASCVILLDPSWNPAADTQATDRVHRIGQESDDVFVFRLITCGTVEEKIYRNQVFKTMAAKQTTRTGQGQPDHFFRYFTRLQLRAMFDLDDLTQSQTAEQLLQLHPAGVSAQVRTLTDGVPCVCAVSDNGRVLNEAVAAPDVEEAGEKDEDVDAFFRDASDASAQTDRDAQDAQGYDTWQQFADMKRQRSPGTSQARDEDVEPRLPPRCGVSHAVESATAAPIVVPAAPPLLFAEAASPVPAKGSDAEDPPCAGEAAPGERLISPPSLSPSTVELAAAASPASSASAFQECESDAGSSDWGDTMGNS